MILELFPHGPEMKRRLRVRQEFEGSLHKSQQFEVQENLRHQSWRYRMLWIACILMGLGFGLIFDGLTSSRAMLPVMLILVPVASGWHLGKKEDRFWQKHCPQPSVGAPRSDA